MSLSMKCVGHSANCVEIHAVKMESLQLDNDDCRCICIIIVVVPLGCIVSRLEPAAESWLSIVDTSGR